MKVTIFSPEIYANYFKSFPYVRSYPLRVIRNSDFVLARIPKANLVNMARRYQGDFVFRGCISLRWEDEFDSHFCLFLNYKNNTFSFLKI